FFFFFFFFFFFLSWPLEHQDQWSLSFFTLARAWIAAHTHLFSFAQGWHTGAAASQKSFCRFQNIITRSSPVTAALHDKKQLLFPSTHTSLYTRLDGLHSLLHQTFAQVPGGQAHMVALLWNGVPFNPKYSISELCVYPFHFDQFSRLTGHWVEQPFQCPLAWKGFRLLS
ncbi:hypothetical protein IWX47DRAFT_865147, partial [Phyllosticta citricarpa]